jgi:hypothetical protein
MPMASEWTVFHTILVHSVVCATSLQKEIQQVNENFSW